MKVDFAISPSKIKNRKLPISYVYSISVAFKAKFYNPADARLLGIISSIKMSIFISGKHTCHNRSHLMGKVWILPKCWGWFTNVSNEGPSSEQRENIGGSKNTKYIWRKMVMWQQMANQNRKTKTNGNEIVARHSLKISSVSKLGRCVKHNMGEWKLHKRAK